MKTRENSAEAPAYRWSASDGQIGPAHDQQVVAADVDVLLGGQVDEVVGDHDVPRIEQVIEGSHAAVGNDLLHASFREDPEDLQRGVAALHAPTPPVHLDRQRFARSMRAGHTEVGELGRAPERGVEDKPVAQHLGPLVVQSGREVERQRAAAAADAEVRRRNHLSGHGRPPRCQRTPSSTRTANGQTRWVASRSRLPFASHEQPLPSHSPLRVLRVPMRRVAAARRAVYMW